MFSCIYTSFTRTVLSVQHLESSLFHKLMSSIPMPYVDKILCQDDKMPP